MSQTTFALPLIIADHVSHSHQHGRPSSRGHQRQSRSYRPLSLPSFNSSQGQSDTDTSHAGRAFIEESGHSYNNHNPGAVQWSQQHELKTRNGKQTPRSSRNMATHQHRSVSRFTEYLLRISESNALLHGVLLDEESRGIFYFMLLNLSFMLVQFSYGYLTGSLGLISDSIHMLFDCVALVVGVCAAVMSKWPPNAKFPYGYGKIDTLAGLGNGIFLMLISVEIVYEAVERLFEGNELERTNELLIVSFLGLVVNMVGIFAFHGHHGHHHGHDHGHSHGHAHDHKSSTAASASPTKAQEGGSHGHHHHHGENMQGIYLHIMADALGSLAVVLSTLLVQYTGWSGFDPLASCIIAVLIFASTVPLVSSTTKILLLSLNSDVEYNLREILSGVSNIRGVIGYTVPKFWIEDVKKDDHDHGHGHDHQHHHDHGHEHHDSRLHTHQDSHHNHQHHDDHHHAHDDHEHDSCTHNHSDHHSRLHAIEKHSHDTNDEPTIFGTIHIQISAYADLRDVQARVNQYFSARKMDVVVQYEREGDRKCWCSALTIGPTNIIRTPQTGAMRTPINGSFSSSLLNATSHMNGNSGKSGLVGKML